MNDKIWLVRIGNRDEHEDAAFAARDGAERHAWAVLRQRWPDTMGASDMPDDLEEAMSDFAASSSTFEEIEITELPLN